MTDKLIKTEVIDKIKSIGFPYHVLENVTVKTVDYTGNRLAPEKYCYKVFYNNYAGKRCKLAFYPNTVGVQGLK